MLILLYVVLKAAIQVPVVVKKRPVYQVAHSNCLKTTLLNKQRLKNTIKTTHCRVTDSGVLKLVKKGPWLGPIQPRFPNVSQYLLLPQRDYRGERVSHYLESCRKEESPSHKSQWLL